MYMKQIAKVGLPLFASDLSANHRSDRRCARTDRSNERLHDFTGINASPGKGRNHALLPARCVRGCVGTAYRVTEESWSEKWNHDHLSHLLGQRHACGNLRETYATEGKHKLPPIASKPTTACEVSVIAKFQLYYIESYIYLKLYPNVRVIAETLRVVGRNDRFRLEHQ
jgi:hypothetical protein